jgi:hypothetical protein
MVNYTGWFTEGTNRKIQINSTAIYRSLSLEVVERLDSNLSVKEIIDWIRNKTREAFSSIYGKNPEGGALNNATGRWNEFIATSLLSEIVLEINTDKDACSAVFSLPNSQSQKEGAEEASSKFLSLFKSSEFASGQPLAKLAPFKDYIFMPSPDYIIVVLGKNGVATSINPLLEQQVKNPDSLALYNFLKGKLQLEQVKAAASLKTSNRSDRRYQPLFEAAMIKAMGYVLHQNWQYYMVASELTPADRTIFTTAVAPHSLALEQNFKLVDGTYLYARKTDLIRLVESAITQ